MNRTRIKICCIQSVDEAAHATAAGADLLGLVGAMPSGPGPISDAAIRSIAEWAPPGVGSVLLSSETSAAGLVRHVRACKPQTLQIVDEPAPGAYAALRAAAPALRIIQVIHVTGAASVDRALGASREVDAILLDSGRPDLKIKQLGGTGRTHNWDISAQIVAALDKPVFLAGGLSPDNVARAVSAVRPFGVDLCSGVRTEGRLDNAKLSAFIAAVNSV